MDVGVLAAVVSFVASLVVYGISAGVYLGKISMLEARANEDRVANARKFEELYNCRNDHRAAIIEQEKTTEAIAERLNKFEQSIERLVNKVDQLLARRVE
jgi:hypothetical protein